MNFQKLMFNSIYGVSLYSHEKSIVRESCSHQCFDPLYRANAIMKTKPAWILEIDLHEEEDIIDELDLRDTYEDRVEPLNTISSLCTQKKFLLSSSTIEMLEVHNGFCSNIKDEKQEIFEIPLEMNRGGIYALDKISRNFGKFKSIPVRWKGELPDYP